MVHPNPTQTYAFSFFLIPAWRWFQNRVRNSGIEQRNDARRQAAALVQVRRRRARLDPTQPRPLAWAYVPGRS